jgi:hypothetical protein
VRRVKYPNPLRIQVQYGLQRRWQDELQQPCDMLRVRERLPKEGVVRVRSGRHEDSRA